MFGVNNISLTTQIFFLGSKISLSHFYTGGTCSDLCSSVFSENNASNN